MDTAGRSVLLIALRSSEGVALAKIGSVAARKSGQ